MINHRGWWPYFVPTRIIPTAEVKRGQDEFEQLALANTWAGVIGKCQP